MIYLPRRAVFIHVPRTGGNSITSAIACACAGRNIDIVVSTVQAWSNLYILNRHIPAKALSLKIDEWDHIFKFAVYREEEERFASLQKLIRRDKEKRIYKLNNCADQWRKVLTDPEVEAKTLSVWKDQKLDFFVKGDHGEDLGVQIYNFNELHEKWPEICEKCQIPYCELPHLNQG